MVPQNHRVTSSRETRAKPCTQPCCADRRTAATYSLAPSANTDTALRAPAGGGCGQGAAPGRALPCPQPPGPTGAWAGARQAPLRPPARALAGPLTAPDAAPRGPLLFPQAHPGAGTLLPAPDPSSRRRVPAQPRGRSAPRSTQRRAGSRRRR